MATEEQPQSTLLGAVLKGLGNALAWAPFGTGGGNAQGPNDQSQTLGPTTVAGMIAATVEVAFLVFVLVMLILGVVMGVSAILKTIKSMVWMLGAVVVVVAVVIQVALVWDPKSLWATSCGVLIRLASFMGGADGVAVMMVQTHMCKQFEGG